MDMGISGRRAIVCGGSAGLGRAIADALAGEGVQVLLAARGAERAEATAAELSARHGIAVDWIATDVTTAEGRSRLLERLPDPDILVNNAGGPPPGNFRTLTRDDWIKALDANMLSAIELISATLAPMVERRFGRVVNITSHMVKQPMAMLSLSNGARAGLTGFTSGIARDVAKHNVTLNNLLPGQFDTDRLRSNQANFAKASGVDTEAARARFRANIPAGRFGDPAEIGVAAAWLCSAHAGFFTAQNLLLDGGEYPGLM